MADRNNQTEHDAAAWAKHRETRRQPYRQPDKVAKGGGERLRYVLQGWVYAGFLFGSVVLVVLGLSIYYYGVNLSAAYDTKTQVCSLVPVIEASTLHCAGNLLSFRS
jgi:hypothetical protein